jgi:hypothetical protein
LIDLATSQYDWVVFDTPPIAVVSDAAVLLNNVPHVLFVIRAFHTQLDRARLALEILRSTPAKTIRAVLNTIDVPTAFASQPYYTGNPQGYYRYYRSRRTNGVGTPAVRVNGNHTPAALIPPAATIPQNGQHQKTAGPAVIDVDYTVNDAPSVSDHVAAGWISSTLAALLLQLELAELEALASAEGWPTHSAESAPGKYELHYPLAKVRGALATAASQ